MRELIEEKIRELCRQMYAEQNSDRLVELTREISALVDEKLGAPAVNRQPEPRIVN